MGFSLKNMFDELTVILNSDMKDQKKVKELIKALAENMKYAKECGLL